MSLGNRKPAGRLTFATNSEHLIFNRHDPPLALSKSTAGAPMLTPTSLPASPQDAFLTATFLPAGKMAAAIADDDCAVQEPENQMHGMDDDEAHHNAEEEASSSSLGYHGEEASVDGRESEDEADACEHWHPSCKLHFGEDSGTESEAESEVSEGSEDSLYLGTTSSSPFRSSISWEFLRGTFSCDSVTTTKECEISCFEDFHTFWGKICSTSSLSPGSVVQFLRRDDTMDRLHGHWWVSYKGDQSGLLASVWSDVLLALMGFEEAENKAFLDHLLGAEYRVGKQASHLLLASRVAPSNLEEEKHAIRSGFQLDGQFALKYVALK